MALSNSIYGQIGKQRVYVDYIQYARAIGYVDHYHGAYIDGDVAAAFDLNPANVNDYVINTTGGSVGFRTRFKNHDSETNSQFSLFLNTVNYFGILGHKLALQGTYTPGTGMEIARVDAYESADYSNGRTSGIVGDTSNPGVGYNLYSINNLPTVDGASSLNCNIYSHTGTGIHFQAEDIIRVGSFTVGRYFDFPNSPDLSVKMNISYDGVKRSRTVGGSDITNITYYKAPDWGDFPAWQHINTDDYDDPAAVLETENYSKTSSNGRRSWQIKFSYVDKEDMFPKSFDGNLVGEYLKQYDSFDNPTIGTKIRDNIITSLFYLTLGGSLKFIFQPDKTKKDFCMCVLDKNTVSVTQVAHGVYDVSLTFVETW